MINTKEKAAEAVAELMAVCQKHGLWFSVEEEYRTFKNGPPKLYAIKLKDVCIRVEPEK